MRKRRCRTPYHWPRGSAWGFSPGLYQGFATSSPTDLIDQRKFHSFRYRQGKIVTWYYWHVIYRHHRAWRFFIKSLEPSCNQCNFIQHNFVDFHKGNIYISLYAPDKKKPKYFCFVMWHYNARWGLAINKKNKFCLLFRIQIELEILINPTFSVKQKSIFLVQRNKAISSISILNLYIWAISIINYLYCLYYLPPE